LDARYTSINIIPEKNKRESTFIVEICYKKKGGGIFPNTCEHHNPLYIWGVRSKPAEGEQINLPAQKSNSNTVGIHFETNVQMITVQPTDISSNEHITL
jgi:hypothetical protein